MANRGYGFLRRGEVTHYFQDARIQSDVFGSAAAGKQQGVVVLLFDLVERSISEKLCPRFSEYVWSPSKS